jgi:hypothetical protein
LTTRHEIKRIEIVTRDEEKGDAAHAIASGLAPFKVASS